MNQLTTYSCNFKINDSNKYALVQCPECHRENYAINVLSGICTWCGFDINKKCHG